MRTLPDVDWPLVGLPRLTARVSCVYASGTYSAMPPGGSPTWRERASVSACLQDGTPSQLWQRLDPPTGPSAGVQLEVKYQQHPGSE